MNRKKPLLLLKAYSVYWYLAGMLLLIGVARASTPEIIADGIPQHQMFDVYVTPGEHDDSLHLRPDDVSLWDQLDRAADYLHHHVFPSLETDESKTYVIESVYTLQHTLRKYPGETERVKSLLAAGRLSVSGTYIPYNSNHHEQESFVRLVTRAKWYLRDKFGYEARFAMCPDAPSLTPQIGQIYKKSGIDLFINNRLASLTTSYFWYWAGLDGTKTLTLHPHYFYGLHASSIYDRQKRGLDSFPSYSSEASKLGHNLFDGLSEMNWPSRTAWVMVGNDFSEPNIGNIQTFINGWNAEKNQNKPMKMSNLLDFMSVVESQIASGMFRPESWTRWGMGWDIRGDDDNFPLIAHLNKARRRMLELEKVSTLCEILNLSKYPVSEIQDGWEKILFGRDHSNLAYIRSIAGESFSDSARQVEDLTERLLDGKLSDIASAIRYKREGKAVAILNTLNWPRTEAVQIELTLPAGAYKAIDGSGAEVPLQVLSIEYVGEGKAKYVFLIMAADIPPVGYRVFYFIRGIPSERTDLSYASGKIENQYYRIVANANGFESIYDKEVGRELIDKNRVSTFQKTKTGETVNFGEIISNRFFDGKVWEFRPLNYLGKGSLISRMVVDSVRIIDAGPVKATMSIKGRLESEGLIITVSLFKGLKRVALKFELIRSGELLDANKDGEPDYVTIPLPLKMANQLKQQFGVIYGSMDNPVLGDIVENTQWPHSPAASGRIIKGGFSQQQKLEGVKGHIGYRYDPRSDKKHVHEWTDISEADDSFGVTIAHPGVLQYERLNFVAPVLCAWEPGLRAWGQNYEKGVPLLEAGDPAIFVRSIPGENYSADLLITSHLGSWKTSGAYKLGSEKNYPLLVGYPGGRSSPRLPESDSFLGLGPENLILTVLKKSEDGSGYVARFYEASDTESQAKLIFNFPKEIGEASRANLLEDVTEGLPGTNNSLSINVLGFGIETVRFSLKSENLRR